MGPGLQFKLPLNIEKSYIVETEVFQNMQFGYRTEEAGTTYRKIGTHWATFVGYGQDESGRNDPNVLIVHDPAPRAGEN